MTSSTIAPWAEPVRWTADDLLRLSDARFRFELVQGELVRMAPTGGSHGLRTGRLHTALGAYVDAHGLGEVAAAETGFDLTQPGDAAQTVLAPAHLSSLPGHSRNKRAAHGMDVPTPQCRVAFKEGDDITIMRP